MDFTVWLADYTTTAATAATTAAATAQYSITEKG